MGQATKRTRENRTITVRYSRCSFRGHFGSKIDQKTHVRNQIQVPGPAASFLVGETVGCCLNTPAGPICSL